MRSNNLPDPSRRKRLTWSVTLYGALLSVSAVNVYLVSLPPWYVEAQHLEFWPALFFSAAAAIGAIIVLPTAVFHLRDRAQNPVSILAWLGFGIGYGIFTPLFTGALFPLASLPIDYMNGEYTLGEMPNLVIDALLIGIRAFVVEGVPAVPTWLAAGIPFALGAYILDRLNTSNNDHIPKYGVWVVAIAMALPVLGFSLFGPPEMIRDIGLS